MVGEGFEWSRSDFDGLLRQAIEQFAARLGRAAVEAERELVQVVVQGILGNGTLMSTHYPTFEKRDDAVDTGEQMLALGLATLDLPIVKIPFQPQVGRQPIGPDRGPRLDGVADEPVQAVLRQVGNVLKPNPPDARSILLGGNHNQGLVLRQATHHAFFLAAPVGLVDFHDALEPIPPGANHRSAKLVEDRPGRPVAAQPQDSLQSQRTDPVLLRGDVPHGAEPQRQRFVRVLEEGSRRHRRLMTTGGAQPEPSLHWPGSLSFAGRANKTAGPTQAEEVLPAGSLRRESGLQFLQRPRIVFHDRKHYKLWQVESSA